MTRERATELLEIYGQAWVKRDPNLILSIFTPDATYLDPAEGKQVGHAGIKAYWQSKVVDSQKDITFKLQNIWVEGETVIAEWHADFTDTKRRLKISLDEVAIFTTQGDKFSALREYYRAEKKPF